jgi:hypothetical protein
MVMMKIVFVPMCARKNDRYFLAKPLFTGRRAGGHQSTNQKHALSWHILFRYTKSRTLPETLLIFSRENGVFTSQKIMIALLFYKIIFKVLEMAIVFASSAIVELVRGTIRFSTFCGLLTLY